MLEARAEGRAAPLLLDSPELIYFDRNGVRSQKKVTYEVFKSYIREVVAK
jgi:hypothetical protein